MRGYIVGVMRSTLRTLGLAAALGSCATVTGEPPREYLRCPPGTRVAEGKTEMVTKAACLGDGFSTVDDLRRVCRARARDVTIIADEFLGAPTWRCTQTPTNR